MNFLFGGWTCSIIADVEATYPQKTLEGIILEQQVALPDPVLEEK